MVLSTNFFGILSGPQNPLLTITQTEMVPSLINSFLLFYDQYGYLPVSDLHFNETNTMTGYHAVPVIADAIMKNIRGLIMKGLIQPCKEVRCKILGEQKCIATLGLFLQIKWLKVLPLRRIFV